MSRGLALEGNDGGRPSGEPHIEDEDEFEDEDDWESGGRNILTNAEFFRIKAINQPRQHRYDASQHLFSGTDPLVRHEAFRDRSIEASSALDRRAARVIEGLCPLAALAFAISFSRIKQGGKACAIELFEQFAAVLNRRLRNIVEKVC